MAVELAQGYVSLTVSTKGLGRDISRQFGVIPRSADRAGRESGRRFGGGLHTALKRGAIATGLAIGGLLGTSLAKGFGRLTAIDNAQAKLKGLGNSAKAVDQIMVDALASVKGTAFGLDEAATVSASAVAAGIRPGKELQKTLKLVADAATIGGASLGEMGAIFNKVASSNKIQGDTINQLNERGIPIVQLLGKTMHKSSAEVTALASKGKIDFKTFQTAMASGLGGSALKSGETFQGALKNVGAALGRFGANLLKGAFPQLTGVFGSLTAGLDAITPSAERVGAVLGRVFAGAVKLIGSAAKGIMGFINGTMLPTLKSINFGPVLAGLSPVMTILKQLLPTLKPLLPAFATLAQTIGGALLAVLPTAGQLFAALGRVLGTVLAAVLPTVVSGLTLVIGAFTKFVTGPGSGAAGVLQRVGAAAGIVAQSFAAFAAKAAPVILAAFRAIAGFIVTQVVPRLVSIGAAVARLFAVVAPIISKIASAIVGAFRDNLPALKSAVDSIKSVITGALELIKAVISRVTKIIGFIWSRFGNNILGVIKAVFGTIIKVIAGALKIVSGVIKLAVALIKGDWGGAWAAIKQILSAALGIIKAVVKGALGILKSLFGGALEWIRAKVAEKINAVRAKFAAIAAYIGGGFRTAWNKVKDFFTRPIDGAKTAISNLLGSGKAGMVTLFRTAVTRIGSALNAIRAAAAKPINFVIGTVYNDGLRKALNLIPGVNLAEAALIKYASGGVLPGWSPGRDIHNFYSPTAGRLALSGGEGILVPQATRRLGGERGIKRINDAARRGQAFARGGVVWPVPGHLTSTYPGHTGVDINSPGEDYGNPIRAAQGGRVRVAGSGHGYGNAVFIDTASGFRTIYGHMSRVLTSVGSLVKTGQLIGKVGSTGHSSGPHLHFEVRPNGTYGSAMRFLRGAAGFNTGHINAGLIGAGSDLAGDRNTGDGIFATLKKKIKGMPTDGFWGLAKDAASNVMGSAKSYFIGKITAAISKAKKAASDFFTGSSPLAPGDVSGSAAIVRAAAAKYGWDRGNQWDSLYRLVSGESGFRANAQNPSSTAYGMFQFLDGTWRTVGGHKTRDPRLQSEYGMKYIQNAYGSPANAWSKWQSRSPHWYDGGGLLQPGLSLAMNGTGKPERILTDKQWKVLARNGQQTAPARVTNYNGPIYTVDAAEMFRAQRAQERRDELLSSNLMRR